MTGGSDNITRSSVTTEQYWWEAGVVSMGHNFRAQFLGREVAPVDVKLTRARLGCDMTGQEVVAHLGGKEKAETPIHAIWEFMSRNRRSAGWFLVIARGADGELKVVNFLWVCDEDGWDVGSYPVSPREGGPTCTVLSALPLPPALAAGK